jgi:uncharacterized protein (UPF0332 family)
MDKTEEQRRWQTAEEHRQAAQRLYVEGLYRASVSRGYYACYQAMWVALGDPPLGAWRHGGIAQQFCRGRWADPVLIPTSLAQLLRRLLALYDLRLDADYRALPVAAGKSQEGIDTTNEVFQLMTAHKVI